MAEEVRSGEFEFQILPGLGLGFLKFGMTREETEGLLGIPDKVEIEEDREFGDCHRWRYEKLELVLSFYKRDNYRVSVISCGNPQLILKEYKIIGLGYDEFMKLLPALNLGPSESFDYETGTGWQLDFNQADLSICFLIDSSDSEDKGWVYSVDVFVRYAEDGDTILWPE